MAVTVGINVDLDFTIGIFATKDRTIAVRIRTVSKNPISTVIQCVEDGARQLKFASVRAMMLQTTSVKLSAPFIGKNTISRRSGPKLGLMLTQGLEEEIYLSTICGDVDAGHIISKDMVVRIDEEIDRLGRQIRAPEEEEIRGVFKRILENGAEGIVVSLHHSPLNPENERIIRRIFEIEYPGHYLGSVPVVLSSDVSASLDDSKRTNTALLNTYTQTETARFLFAAEVALKKVGYAKPLLVMHAEGGVARVCKSIPLKCIKSDTAASYLALIQFGNLCGMQQKVGLRVENGNVGVMLLDGGSYAYNHSPSIDGMPVSTPTLEFVSMGTFTNCALGGYEGAIIMEGDQPAGREHGPRGERATLRDALVTLEYDDPNHADGNEEGSSSTKSHQAVEEAAVAHPLGVSVEESVHRAFAAFNASVFAGLQDLAKASNFDLESSVLVSMGGDSGICCCHVAERLGISKVYCPPFVGALSAFGCLTAQMLHSYELCGEKTLHRSAENAEIEWFNTMVQNLQKIAADDMKGEGLAKDALTFTLELLAESGGRQSTLSSPLRLSTKDDLEAVLSCFAKQIDPEIPVNELRIQLFRLRATCYTTHYQLHTFEFCGADPQKAFVKRRQVYLDGAFRKVDVYRRELLACGNIVPGPALILSPGDTVFVPSGKSYLVDKFLGGLIS